MNAIVLEAPGTFRAVEVPSPNLPQPGEVIVRTRRVGVCGTDLHAFVGDQPFFTYPRILGHELGVEVVAVAGDQTDLRPGDMCAVEPYLNCGRCVACRHGRSNCCVRLNVIGVHVDGGMRAEFAVPHEKLHRSSILTLDQLALVEPLSIGAHAVARANVVPGETALVIGTGPIGLAVTQFAQLAGARVLVLDLNDTRLDFCRRVFGVESISVVSIAAGRIEVVRELESLTDCDLPIVVFDATGNPRSMESSFEYAAHGGRIVFVGLCQSEITFHDPNFHRRELTLMSSRNATRADFERVIALLEAGRVEVASWVSHRVSGVEMIEMFPRWLESPGGFTKALVEF